MKQTSTFPDWEHSQSYNYIRYNSITDYVINIKLLYFGCIGQSQWVHNKTDSAWFDSIWICCKLFLVKFLNLKASKDLLTMLFPIDNMSTNRKLKKAPISKLERLRMKINEKREIDLPSWTLKYIKVWLSIHQTSNWISIYLR